MVPPVVPPVSPRAQANQVCMTDGDSYLRRRQFDVSVVRACDLYGSCDGGAPRGIQYNDTARLDLHDAKAIVYVLNSERMASDGGSWSFTGNANSTTLTALQKQFQQSGRPLEPLVLRAAAGECIEIGLRNHLPAKPMDGPDEQGRVLEAAAYHNFLPMIADGFNINQFAMSSSVGLSIPRLAQQPLYADGSNVGLNGKVLALSEGPGTAFRQGALLPPCVSGKPDDARCRKSSFWRAADFGQGNKAIEFGALPISSFGDVIKHPAHGLVGAMVIGPENSRVCGPESTASASRLSVDICDAGGAKLYTDHVLVMQDGVSAHYGQLPVRNLSGAEEPDDYGMKAINYKSDPLWGRRGGDQSVEFGSRNEADYSQVLSSAWDGVRCASGVVPIMARTNHCDPEAPVLEALRGEKQRLHFVHPGGHTRQQGLEISGHAFNPFPWSSDSRHLDANAGSSIRQGVYNAFGPQMAVTLEITAGGAKKVPMDYLIRSQASFLFDGGQWGILRVR